MRNLPDVKSHIIYLLTLAKKNKKLDDEFYHVICEYGNEDDGRSDFDHVINVKIPIKDFECLINEHLLPYLNEKNEAILKDDDFSVHFHKTRKQDFKVYL